MKTALALVCSLIFAWTQFVPAQIQVAGVAHCTGECCPCSGASCCAPTPMESQPVSATPFSGSPNHLAGLMPILLAWALPAIETDNPVSPLFALPHAAPVPLYQRNCAWLI